MTSLLSSVVKQPLVRSLFLEHSVKWKSQDIKLLVALGWQVWERMYICFLFVPNDISYNWTSLNKKSIGLIGVEQHNMLRRQITESDSIRAGLSSITQPCGYLLRLHSQRGVTPSEPVSPPWLPSLAAACTDSTLTSGSENAAVSNSENNFYIFSHTVQQTR